MRRKAVGGLFSLVAMLVAVAAHAVPAHANARGPRLEAPAAASLTLRTADSGVDIVRMPLQPPPSVPQRPAVLPMSPDPTPLLKPAQPKTAPIETARP
jgi:hypothetical protein